ncbi:MAG: hypothetical protein MUE85_01420 [Microscillaceae bacterium]|jgi:hypothetical protein|nr:hypothetical protein [Microscillaceae bacterium]
MYLCQFANLNDNLKKLAKNEKNDFNSLVGAILLPAYFGSKKEKSFVGI